MGGTGYKKNKATTTTTVGLILHCEQQHLEGNTLCHRAVLSCGVCVCVSLSVCLVLLLPHRSHNITSVHKFLPSLFPFRPHHFLLLFLILLLLCRISLSLQSSNLSSTTSFPSQSFLSAQTHRLLTLSQITALNRQERKKKEKNRLSSA